MPDPRIGKFKRQAPKIQTADHLRKILESFPEEQRAELLDSARGLISSDVMDDFNAIDK